MAITPVRSAAAEVKVTAILTEILTEIQTEIQKTAMLILLAYCSKEDIKTKQIPVIPVAVFMILGLFLNLKYEGIGIFQMLGGASIGMVMLVFSILSGEKVGKGDALILGCVGVFFGFYPTLFMWWGSSVLLAVYGVVMIALKKISGRKAKLPYIPFLLTSYMLCLAAWMFTDM